jgi:hypothetical protein
MGSPSREATLDRHRSPARVCAQHRIGTLVAFARIWGVILGGVGTFDDFFVAVVLSPLLAASSFALIMVWMFGHIEPKKNAPQKYGR